MYDHAKDPGPGDSKCPHCGEDLLSVAAEAAEVYDGSLLWECPFCKGMVRENPQQVLFKW